MLLLMDKKIFTILHSKIVLFLTYGMSDLGFLVPICRLEMSIGLDKQFFEHKIANIFLPISFNICLGRSKEPSL